MQLPLLITGAALCGAAIAGLYMDHLGEQRTQSAELRAEAELAEGQMLPRTPSGTLRSLHTLIGSAEHGATCSLMTRPAQQAFATVHGQTDCSTAARTLGAQVTNRNRYPMFRFAERDQIIQGELGGMDGCAITWRDAVDPSGKPDPGPRLGRFTMYRVAGLGFKITGVDACAPISGSTTNLPPTSPQAATTSSRSAGLLPGYAPSIPGVLAGRIARNDPAACAFFTDAGRAQFVAARKAVDCAAAVANMHAQVSNPKVYADPHGATEAPGPAGRTVVDGCHLTWSSWSGSDRPGPQIGRIELVHSPGQVGYLIAGYRSC